MERQRSGDYGSLLQEAFAMGRTDGTASAGRTADPGSGLSGGLDPEELAALLWAPRPGQPPAGLVLNAPHWFTAGRRSAPAPAGVPTPRRAVARDETASPGRP